MKLLKKLKKSKYLDHKKLLKLAENNIEQFNKNHKKIVPIRLVFVEKRKTDRSTLYSIDGPLQLMHADIENLTSLGKSTTIPRYTLLAVDLYSLKVYIYHNV